MKDSDSAGVANSICASMRIVHEDGFSMHGIVVESKLCQPVEQLLYGGNCIPSAFMRHFETNRK